MSDYQLVPVGVSPADNAASAQLLSSVFKKPKLFTDAYIHWEYGANPTGHIVGMNAYQGKTLAAHYVTQPIEAMIGGGMKLGLLSLNTATHPAHQGKGLFVKLADQTYRMAADAGYQFVIGVANQNSVHGFIKKLGFTLIGQLDARVGIGSLPIPSDMSQFEYSRVWTTQSLSWRVANPITPYTLQQGRIYSPTAYPLIHALIGAFDTFQNPIPDSVGSTGLFHLWIGLNRMIGEGRGWYVDIPSRFRPAPLYLIMKDLKGGIAIPQRGEVYFQAMDFDAY